MAFNPQTAKPIRQDVNFQEKSGLPGEKRVMALQEKRTPAMQTLKEELSTPSKPGFFQPVIKGAVTGAKAIGVPFEAIESGIARPLQKLQEIPPSMLQEGTRAFKEALIPTMAKPLVSREERDITSDDLKEAGRFLESIPTEAAKGFVGGLTGKEQPVEIGDIPRRAGFSEPLSAFIGFGTMLGAVDPLVGKSLTGGYNKIANFFKGSVPIKSPTDITYKHAKDLFEGVDDIRRSLGNKISETINHVKGLTVDEIKFNRVIKEIPDDVLSRISKDKFFKVKKLINGNIDPNIENAWNLRKALDEFLTTKDFTSKIGSAKKRAIRDSRKKIAEILRNTDESIAPVMDKFSRFMDKFEPIRDILTDKRGNIVEKGLRDVFATGLRIPERSKQKFFIEMQDFFPETLNIVQEIVRFNRRLGIKRAVKGAARTGASIGLLRGAFRGIGGDGGSSSDKGGN